jgi:hypothetical protein
MDTKRRDEAASLDVSALVMHSIMHVAIKVGTLTPEEGRCLKIPDMIRRSV